MITLFLIVLALVILALATLAKGANNSDRVDSVGRSSASALTGFPARPNRFDDFGNAA